MTLNWLPFDHVVPMLTYHLADVYLQRVAVQVPTAEVVGDPLLWLRTMSAHRVTHSWAPNFGFKLVAQADAAGAAAKIDLSSVQRLMNAGEQVTAEVCDAFLACTGLHPSVMQPAFGMAEVCTCMTYNSSYIGGGVGGSSTIRVLKSSLQAKVLELAPEDVPSAQCAHFMDLGLPSPGVEIRISAEKGWVLGERQVGRLQIKGPCVMGGYHNNPKANAECMLADGWFDSGDLGFLHQGRLYLTGRAKEMIICRGANYYCYEIEDSVMTVAGTLPARVAATSVYDENQGTEVLLIFFVPANPAGLVHPSLARSRSRASEGPRRSRALAGLLGIWPCAASCGAGRRCGLPSHHLRQDPARRVQKGLPRWRVRHGALRARSSAGHLRPRCACLPYRAGHGTAPD